MTTNKLFHRLWTKAVGTTSYDKKEWLDLEKDINMANHYIIREWVPPQSAISNLGFWGDIRETKTENLEQANITFGKLMSQGRIVQLVKRQESIIAECAIPPWERD